MKDDKDGQTQELPIPTSKAERFRAKQIAAGLRQFSFWLTKSESDAVKEFIKSIRGQ